MFVKGLEGDKEPLEVAGVVFAGKLGIDGVDRILAEELESPPELLGRMPLSEALLEAIRRLVAVRGR
jgi:hypothetical protein